MPLKTFNNTVLLESEKLIEDNNKNPLFIYPIINF